MPEPSISATGTTSPKSASQASPGSTNTEASSGKGRNTSTPAANARRAAGPRTGTPPTMPEATTYDAVNTGAPATANTSASQRENDAATTPQIPGRRPIASARQALRW